MAMGKLFVLLAIVLLAVMADQSESKKGLPKTSIAEGEYQPDRTQNYKGSLLSFQCAPQCSRRCSRTQYKKPCLFFCNKCCATCLCVPPGFYGNKGACPCYNNWKTKRGGPKCP